MGSVIRAVAIVMSGFVLLGFAFFAVDEMDRGSKNQQNALANELEGKDEAPVPIAPASTDENIREASNSGFREVVDDVNDVLLGPFVASSTPPTPGSATAFPRCSGCSCTGSASASLRTCFPRNATTQPTGARQSPSLRYGVLAQLPLRGVVAVV